MCHINNKVLLYSIGNYIQHSMISHNGMEKDIFYTHTHTHTHISESLCCTAEINYNIVNKIHLQALNAFNIYVKS